MTVSAQTPYSSQAANGVTTSFPFAYKVRKNTDIVVVLVDASGNETAQTLGVHYTVSGVGSPSGGSVDFLAAPPNGYTVKTSRVTGLARSIDYQSNGDLLAAVINGDVDAVWLALQELVSGTQVPTNVLRAPMGEALSQIVAAALRKDHLLAFNAATGQAEMSPFTVTQLASAIAAAYSGAAGPLDALSFLQAGAGAVSRTAQSKLRDEIHVKDFGAVGDGVTDDTAAIQAAINAAIAGKARRVLFESRHKITDVNLTKLFFCGLILEGTNLTHQNGGAATGTIIVSGATSQGFDLSGTSGLVLRNLSFLGDAAAPPRCSIFAQRVNGSPESYGHTFQNVRTYGNYTKAAVYNYAGEMWDFQNCILWCEGGGGVGGYFTSTNSLGLASKFQAPDSTATPLTITAFRKCDLKGVGAEAIWFEQQTATSGDRMVQNILFDGCYSRANGGAANVFKFTEVFGGATFRSCTDESFATSNPTAAATIIKIEGARTFRDIAIEDCYFYPRSFILDASAPVQNYRAENNWCGNNNGNWRFADLRGARHDTLYSNETFVVTTLAVLVSISPADRTAQAKITLPAARMNQAYDSATNVNPTGVINPETRGKFIFDNRYNRLYVSVGVPAGADSFSWRPLGEKEVRSALPTTGNYELGQIIWRTSPAAGGKIGWICTSTGTFGALAGVTGSINSGTTALTVNDATNLSVGNRITIAGVSGLKSITNVSGLNITVDTAADATVAGAAVAYVNPVFKDWGAIDP